MSHLPGRLVDIGDTALFCAELGDPAAYPVMIFHGGPGFDHHEFGDYLNPLADRGCRLIFVDERGQGRSGPSAPSTWTLPKMAEDVVTLGRSLGLDRTIVSSGIPSVRYLEVVEKNLASFEPVELRERIAASWDRESRVETEEEMDRLWLDQAPFHFADPLDPRIEEYNQQISLAGGAKYSPEVLRAFAAEDYGHFDVEERLGDVTQPVLVMAGRHDRACSVEAAGAIARGIPNAELVVFQNSAHMTFVEETAAYLDAVDAFLRKHV